MKNLPWDAIEAACEGRPFSAKLVAAIVQVESGGVRWRTRYERDFRYTVSPREFARRLGITELTEEIHQKTSWGLMQVMGGTARDEGFQGHLTSLVEVSEGLYWGCTYLERKWDRYNGSIPEVVSAYNSGHAVKFGEWFSNQEYVDRVLSLLG